MQVVGDHEVLLEGRKLLIPASVLLWNDTELVFPPKIDFTFLSALNTNVRIKSATETINSNAFDQKSWNTLLDYCKRLLNSTENTDNVTEAANIFRAYLQVFPLDADIWVELSYLLDDDEEVLDLFCERLLACPSVRLWKAFIDVVASRTTSVLNDQRTEYEEKLNQIKDGSVDDIETEEELDVIYSSKFVETIRQLEKHFVVAASHVGCDINAGVFFTAYIDELKTLLDAFKTFEEVLKVLQRMICAAYETSLTYPTLQCGEIVEQYNAFLGECGTSTALAQRAHAYVTEVLEPMVDMREASFPASEDLFGMTLPFAEAAKLLPVYRNMIAIEESFLSTVLTGETRFTKEAAINRVKHAYRLACCKLSNCAEVWWHYACFLCNNNMFEAGRNVLIEGIRLNPTETILYFGLVETIELQAKENIEQRDALLDECLVVFRTLLRIQPGLKCALYQFELFGRRYGDAVAQRKIFLDIIKNSSSDPSLYLMHARREHQIYSDPDVALSVLDYGDRVCGNDDRFLLQSLAQKQTLGNPINVTIAYNRVLDRTETSSALLNERIHRQFLSFEQYNGTVTMLRAVTKRMRALKDGPVSDFAELILRTTVHGVSPVSNDVLTSLGGVSSKLVSKPNAVVSHVPEAYDRYIKHGVPVFASVQNQPSFDVSNMVSCRGTPLVDDLPRLFRDVISNEPLYLGGEITADIVKKLVDAVPTGLSRPKIEGGEPEYKIQRTK
ncbi:hypothetical protein PCE1_002730 [Barthelona sp. PCE]